MKDSCRYGPDPSGVKMFSLLFVFSLSFVQGIPGRPHNAGSIRIRSRSESASGRLKFGTPWQ